MHQFTWIDTIIMEVLILLRKGFEITLLAYFNIQAGQELIPYTLLSAVT